MSELPSGTVTFLFTDIEGSTRLLRDLGDAYAPVLGAQRQLITEAVVAQGGRVFGTEGDAVFAVFPDATAGVRAAAAAQYALASHPWPEGHPVRVRMGIHTGEVTLAGRDYVGLTLHEVARIAAAGHGGQVLVSSLTRDLARRDLPGDLELRDLGEHRLKDLAGAEHLYQLAGPGIADRFPAIRSLAGRANNLPAQLTSFVGRDVVAQATALLEVSRLLTLTGPGGTGKTRAALQVAADSLDRHPDGVWFVPLEAVTDADLVPGEILTALGVTVAGSADPTIRLLGHLADRRLLLVLDNLEQVVAVGPLVTRMLREAPGLRVLVTSRIPLHVSGEQELPIPPLGLPDDATGTSAVRSEAVLLFVERAMSIQPTFQLSATNTQAIVDIVRRLDGLPLAIELAAARVRSLSPEAIRGRIDRSLGLLTGGARDLPERQQTLRGAIAWSHDLLEPAERRLFARLGVFAGGAALELAETVCGPADGLGIDVLDGLESLTDKSLVRALPEATEPRFTMLSTIREYAGEQLDASGDRDVIDARFHAAFLDLAEAASANLTGDGARGWLDRLALEHDNLRAVLDDAEARDDAELAMRMATALWRFWQIRGLLLEATGRLDRIIALPSAATVSPRIRARALGAAGSVAYWRGDYPGMHGNWTKALEEALRCGDPATIADAHFNLGFASSPERDLRRSMYAQGRDEFARALVIYRELGDQQGIGRAAWATAVGDFYQGHTAESRVHSAEALALARASGDLFYVAWSLWMIGLADLVSGAVDDALVRIGEALRAFQQMGDHSGPVLCLMATAMAMRARGDETAHWTLRGAVEQLRSVTGADLVRQVIPGTDWNYEERPTTAADQEAWDVGASFSEAEAIDLALGMASSDV